MWCLYAHAYLRQKTCRYGREINLILHDFHTLDGKGYLSLLYRQSFFSERPNIDRPWDDNDTEQYEEEEE